MKISEKVRNDGIIEEKSIYPNYTNGKMNIEITSQCNEKCVYCFYSAKGVHKIKKEINSDLFYRVTKEAYELGIREIGLYIKGEPFLNKNIYDYVKYLKDLGFTYIYISTNGLLCNIDNLKRIVEAGIDSIKFSISASNNESFKKHHGIDGFDIVYKNIRDAYNYRKESKKDFKLFTFSILTQFNLQEKEEIQKVFSPYVDEVYFLNVQDDIIRLKGLREHLMVDKNQDCYSKGERQIPCPQLFNRVVIDEEGFLCSCCYSQENLTRIIDLNTISLKDAVYCEEFLSLRKQHLENNLTSNICRRCIYGIEEDMVPLTSRYNFDTVNIPYIDYEEEIKKRFNIK